MTIQDGTFSPRDLSPVIFDSGFWVSMGDYETKISAGDAYAYNVAIQRARKIAAQLGAYVGVWTNDNVCYVDVSAHYAALDAAIDAAIFHRQKAIYDIAAGENVFVGVPADDRDAAGA